MLMGVKMEERNPCFYLDIWDNCVTRDQAEMFYKNATFYLARNPDSAWVPYWISKEYLLGLFLVLLFEASGYVLLLFKFLFCFTCGIMLYYGIMINYIANIQCKPIARALQSSVLWSNNLLSGNTNNSLQFDWNFLILAKYFFLYGYWEDLAIVSA